MPAVKGGRYPASQSPGNWAYFVTVHALLLLWVLGKADVEGAWTRLAYLALLFCGTYAAAHLIFLARKR